jgi:2-oxoglutarate ferredoxin oxidoreductase subunit gamma
MHTEVMFAGFGGQGILFAGKLLALAGMEEGRQVVWLPSYGPEMRGGTANCTVVISDDPIASPIISNPKNIVVMNRPSLEKYGRAVKPGGILIINSSLIPDSSDRTDIDVINVPCNQIAIDTGSQKAANMVALGALIRRSGIVDYERTKELIKHYFEGNPKVVDINLRAFDRGAEIASQEMKS